MIVTAPPLITPAQIMSLIHARLVHLAIKQHKVSLSVMHKPEDVPVSLGGHTAQLTILVITLVPQMLRPIVLEERLVIRFLQVLRNVKPLQGDVLVLIGVIIV